MNLFGFPLLADENIHPDIVAYLRQDGLDITSTSERGHFGLSDTSVLRQAFRAGRIILTHDSDFGAHGR